MTAEEQILNLDKKTLLPARKAARILDCAPDYIGKLCREGKLKGELVKNVWHVDQESLKTFELEREKNKVIRAEVLAAQRQKENLAYQYQNAGWMWHVRHAAKEARTVVVVSVLIGAAVCSAAVGASSRFGSYANSLPAALAHIDSPFFAPSTPDLSKAFGEVGDYFASLFKTKPLAVTTPVVVPPTTVANTTVATLPPAPTTAKNYPVIEHTIEHTVTTVQSGITEQDLAARLQTLSNTLRSEFYGAFSTNPSAPASQGGFQGQIALSQHIDSLGNVTITNLTVHGISGITADDIPTLSYFPATSTISAQFGGTGISSYNIGDILYASSANTLSVLPIGSSGRVLKVAGGLPTWGVDVSGGGGGSGAWATTTDNLAVYPSDTSQVVLIGNDATTTSGNIFEVTGNSLFRNSITAYGTITAPRFVATSSLASNFPFASSTAITVSGTAFINTLSLTNALNVVSGGTGSTTLTGVLVGNGTNGVQTATIVSPLAFSGSTLTIQQANGSQSGYLSSTDFNTFNNKISSTSLSAGAGISYNSSTGLIVNTIGYPFPSDATTTLLNFNGGLITTNATTTSFAISNIAPGSLLKTTTGGSLLAAIAGTDYQAAGNYATFGYLFPSNATTTSIAFNGGLSATGGSLTNTTLGSTTLTGAFAFANATGTNATTTNFSTTFASTTNLIISSAAGTGTRCLQVGADGTVSANGSACGTGSSASEFSFINNYGVLTAATSSALFAQSGIFASSTSHFVNADFTNSTTTNATTTGNAYFGGRVSVSAGSTAATSIGLSGAPDLGIYFPDTSNIGFAQGGVLAFDIGASFLKGKSDALIGFSSNDAYANGFDTALSRYAAGVFAFGTGTQGNTSAGIIAAASSTIGAGGQTTGLTINGGATTTLNAYFASKVAIGTTSPFANLSINANNGDTNQTLFAISSSTANSTTTLFTISNTGAVNINGTLTGAGLAACNGTTDKLLYANGTFSCGTDQNTGGGGGSFPFSASTNYGQVVYATSTPTLWFQSGVFASSTSHFVNADFTSATTTYATTTNLAVTSLTTGALLKTLASGAVVAATPGTDYANFGYLFTANATSTLLGFSGGILSIASTTIGNGTQGSGLTISGGATTTGNAYFAGKVGIGTTNPADKLQVGDGSADIRLSVMSNSVNQFTAKNALGNSIKYGATTDTIPNAVISNNDGNPLVTITNDASLGVGTTSPFAALSVAGASGVFADHYVSYGTTASQLAYASSTALTVSGTASTTNLVISSAAGTGTRCLQVGADGTVTANGSACGTGGGTSDFTFLTNYGSLTAATSSPVWAQGGIFASSTSHFVNADFANSTTTNATTTSFAISNIAAGSLLKTTTGGSLVAAVLGTDYQIFGYPFIGNATSTLLNFNGGLTSASTTLTGAFVFGNATGTNATTTALSVSGNLYVPGSVGTCNTITDKVLYANGQFSCGIDLNTGSGGGFSYTTYYGSLTGATTSALWAQGGIFASSTSHFADIDFVNATSTTLSVSNNLGIGTTTGNAKLAVNGGNILQVASGAPTLAATVSTTSTTHSRASVVAGRFLYSADYEAGLRIIDISNPKVPTVAGSINTGMTHARSVAVAGKYAYVGDETSGLKIVDVSNISSPTVVGTLAGVSPYGVAVSGKYVYLADFNNAALKIVDVSNPTSPVVVGSYAGSQPYGVVVQGKYAYLADNGNSEVDVIDISNPVSPIKTAGYIGNTPTGLYISGKYLYVADNGGGFYILNISNPNSLGSAIGTYDATGNYYGVQVAGNYAYLADHNGNMKVVDITTPTSLQLVGTLAVGDQPYGITVSGKYAYVAANGNSTKVVDINGAQLPAAHIGSLESNTINVSDNLTVGGDISAGGGLDVGISGIFSRGTIAAYIASTTQTNPVVATFMGGNVGIGTTTPFAKLSVAGNLTLDQYSSYQLDGVTVLSATSTTFNTLVGILAGANLVSTSTDATSGIHNIALGYQALQNATSTDDNVAIGYLALQGSATNFTAANNVAVGSNALKILTTGASNVAIGSNALSAVTTGTRNVAVGLSALTSSTGSNNIAIGPQAGTGVISGSNNIIIGAGNGSGLTLSSLTNNNQLTIQNIIFGTNNSGSVANASTGQIGIGSTSPFARFAVQANNGDTNTTLFAIGSSTQTATTTLFSVNNIGSTTLASTFGTCNTTNALTTNSSGTIVCGAVSVSSAASSTLLADFNTFTGNNMFLGSTTIGAGGQTTGLTINGGATTTGFLTVQGTGTTTFAGNVGIGTTSSVATLGLQGSIGVSTSQLFLSSAGNVGIGTNQPVSSWQLNVTGNIGLSTGADRTIGIAASTNGSANSLILQGGIRTGGSGAGGHLKLLGGGGSSGAGGNVYLYPGLGNGGGANGNILLGTDGTNFAGNVGIGTTTAYAKLSLQANSGDTNTTLFAIGSSTATATSTLFSISNTGSTTLASTFGTCNTTSALTTNSSGTIVCGPVSVSSAASSTLLADTNLWSGANTFSSTTLNGASLFANATTTSFAITNIGSGSLLKTTTGGAVIAAVAGTDYLTSANVSAYPFALTGNATSTLTQFNGGLTAYASSTIGDGTAVGGLTINGGSTTTLNAYFASKVAIGTTSPFANLSVHANNGSTATTLFAIGSSTATATTTLFSVLNTGTAYLAGSLYSKGITWTARSAAGNNDSWKSVTYGNGLFVAISFSGDRVMTSPDGINWTTRSAAGNNDTWVAVTYGNGLFVAVGSSGDRVMTSPDGITWTVRSAAGNDDGWRGVTYGNGLFVAVSDSDTTDAVMTSPDGINWTVRSGAGGNDDWSDVTYGNGLFVAVASSASNDHVMTSPDGITWTVRSAAGNDDFWGGVIYGNGLFVAVSLSGDRVMTSPDGITWTVRSAAGDNDSWDSVAYGNGLFVAVSSNGGTPDTVMTSPDGINWTARSAAGDNDDWNDIVYANGLFVAVGPSGDRVMTSGQLEQTQLATNNTYQGGAQFFGNVGIGTSTPYAQLSIQYSTTTSNTAFAIGSTTLSNTNATLFSVTNTGSTTLFQIPSSILKTDSSGTIVAAVAGTDYLTSANVSAYPFALTGNATSTLTQFNGGLTAFASSTIGAGGQTTGLTINGGATTTGFLTVQGTGTSTFVGSLAVGSTSPFAQFSLHAKDGNSYMSNTLFAIGSSTANSTSTLFSVNNIGSTTLASAFGTCSGASALNVNSNGTIVCGTVTASASLTGTIGQTAYFSGTNTAAGTSTLYIDTTSRVGVATTSPFSKFSIHANNGDTNQTLFAIGSSTATATSTLFSVSNTGAISAASGNLTVSSAGALTSASTITTNAIYSFSNANGSINALFTGSVKIRGGLGGTAGASVQIDNNTNALTITSGTGQLLLVTDASGSGFSPASGSAVLNTAEIQYIINQTGTSNGITRGLFINPTITAATDYRALETAGYTLNLAKSTTTLASVIENAFTIASTSAATVTNAYQENITGAPIASTNVTITNSAALNIAAASVKNGGTVTNATGLIVNAPTGGTNNYAAQFLGGFVGVGSSSPFATLSIHATSTGSNTTLFAIGSSTATATTTLFSVSNTGRTVITAPTLGPGNNVLTVNASGGDQFTVDGDGNGVFTKNLTAASASLFVSNSNGFTHLASTFGLAWTSSGVGNAGNDDLYLKRSRVGTLAVGQTGTAGEFTGTVIAERLGLGTSTPYALLGIIATSTNGTGAPTTLFAIASTTGGTSTSTLFSVSNTGMAAFVSTVSDANTVTPTSRISFTTDRSGVASTAFFFRGRLYFPGNAGPEITFGNPSGPESDGFAGDGVGRVIGNGGVALYSAHSARLYCFNGVFCGVTQDQMFGWSSSSVGAATSLDTSFTRLGAAKLALGNGVLNNYSGTLALESIGLGTSTPYAQFSLVATSTNGIGARTTLFAIASTTGGTSTSTLFSVSNIGSTTLASAFGTCSGASALNVNSNGTIVCGTVTASASLTGTIGQTAYFSGINTAAGTSTLFISTGSLVGVGSSTPWAKFSVDTSNLAANVPSFSVGSSTRTSLVVTQAGNVGIGTSSPFAEFMLGANGNPGYAESNVGVVANNNIEAFGLVGNTVGTNLNYYLEGTTTRKVALQAATGGTGSGGTFAIFTANNAGTITQRATFDNSGNFGVGSTSPGYLFSAQAAASSPQAAIAYDNTHYTTEQTDSNGDEFIYNSGNDALFNNANLWVCTGGSGVTNGCPSGTPTNPGSLIVEGDVGIGTSTPVQKLGVAGKLFVSNGLTTNTLGTATSTFMGDIKILGKLDVSTIDPVYTIDGTKYATYGASTIGVHEETLQTIALQKDSTGGYSYDITFDSLKEGSDLWLFYQITDFGTDWQNLVVSLTPAFDGSVHYEKVPNKHELIVKGTSQGEVSMRLSALRFDNAKWPNLRPDQADTNYKGFEINSKPVSLK